MKCLALFSYFFVFTGLPHRCSTVLCDVLQNVQKKVFIIPNLTGTTVKTASPPPQKKALKRTLSSVVAPLEFYAADSAATSAVSHSFVGPHFFVGWVFLLSRCANPTLPLTQEKKRTDVYRVRLSKNNGETCFFAKRRWHAEFLRRGGKNSVNAALFAPLYWLIAKKLIFI